MPAQGSIMDYHMLIARVARKISVNLVKVQEDQEQEA